MAEESRVGGLLLSLDPPSPFIPEEIISGEGSTLLLMIGFLSFLNLFCQITFPKTMKSLLLFCVRILNGRNNTAIQEPRQ